MQIKINPVFRKELKVATRSWKIAITLLIYTGILAVIGVLIFGQIIDNLAYSMSYQEFTTLYMVVSLIQFGLILFVVPALTAGTISGERERQTLEIMLSTPLRSFSILIGKLVASLSTVVLLIIASMPILALVFIFGGVSITQLLLLMGYYIVTTIYIGSIGIFISTVFRRTTVSNVMAYGVVLFLTFGSLIFVALYMNFVYRYNYYYGVPNNVPAIMKLLYANPLQGFGSIMMEQLGNMGGGFSVYYDLGKTPKQTLQINIIVELVISMILISIASWRLNPKKGKFLSRRRKKVKGVKA